MRQVMLKQAHELYNNLEVITAFSSCMLVHMNINWADKITGFIFSISASLISALLVSFLKDWKSNGKKK
jgi:hypothetical protein